MIVLDKDSIAHRGPYPDIHQGQIDETDQDVDRIDHNAQKQGNLLLKHGANHLLRSSEVAFLAFEMGGV